MSITPTPSPTAPPLAQITPFSPTGLCTGEFTSAHFVYSSESFRQTFPLYVSKEQEWCGPEGWTMSNFHFSPAVCPNRWTAYMLGTTYSRADEATALSTAYCCSRGFSAVHPYDFALPGISTVACISRAIEDLSDLADNDSRTVGVHSAWQVSWKPSDIPILSPSPPNLGDDCGTMAVWRPGDDAGAKYFLDTCEEIHKNRAAGEVDEVDHSYDGLMEMAIAFPIVGAVALGVGIWLCCRCARKKKAKKAAARDESVRMREMDPEAPPPYGAPEATPPKYAERVGV